MKGQSEIASDMIVEDAAYSICAADKDNEYVLISLFAVFEDYRGKGIGTAFMDALKTLYMEKRGIIVEVEKPECAESKEELESRNRRIEFYQKSGFHQIQGIDYTIWDVPMHLMVFPFETEEITSDGIGLIMYQIYLRMMGEHLMHKMEFRVL
jgi:hypothetical protein